jgi:hypothetical protein
MLKTDGDTYGYSVAESVNLRHQASRQQRMQPTMWAAAPVSEKRPLSF